MGLRDRIGVDVGRQAEARRGDRMGGGARGALDRHPARHRRPTRSRASTTAARPAFARACERHGVHLGLHTASAVNVAEYAPHVGDAVERYLEAYVEIAPRLGAEWIVIHAGYHFTSDKEMRMAAGRERLKRIVAHAEKHGALVLLENLNKEPDDGRGALPRAHGRGVALLFRGDPLAGVQAVVHRQPRASGARGHRGLSSTRSTSAGSRRCGSPIAGATAMRSICSRARATSISPTCSGASRRKGFAGHYMNAFGSLDDMLAGRDDLVRHAAAAGIVS